MSAEAVVGLDGRVVAPAPPPVRTHRESERTPAHRAWNGHERRSGDRIARLSRQFDALCTSAVDAAEIAAGLESLGFTDNRAAEYGFRDVFSLADCLFGRTPRLVNRRPGKLANPWEERPLRHLTRGVTFALPGLVFIACLPRVTSAPDVIGLAVAMVFGWPAGQTLAFLGYALEGRRHPMAARALLAVGLAACVVASLLYGLIAVALGVSGPVAALGAGELAYLAAAAVVLVLGHEAMVLGSLVPGLVAAALTWWGPPGFLGAPAVLIVGGGATVLLVVGVALATSRKARPRDLRTALDALSPNDRREAAVHAGYGLAGAVLVTLPALSGNRTLASSLTLLPVIWSMGWAEWHIVSMRRRAYEHLNDAISLDFFRFCVRRLAVRSVLHYVIALAGLTAVLLIGLAVVTGVPPGPPVVIACVANGLLGLGFFLALVLSSLGGMRIVVTCMVVAVATGLTGIGMLPWEQGVMAAPLTMLLLLSIPAYLIVGNPTRHM